MTKDWDNPRPNTVTTYQEGIKAAQIAHADYYPLEAPSDDAVTATISAFLTKIRKLGCNVPTIDGEPGKNDAMYFIQTVYDTFIKDEAQGSRSRDRQFAIDLLGKALKAMDKSP